MITYTTLGIAIMISSHIEENFYQNISKITLQNGTITASFLNFGARMYELFTPDKNGVTENILLSLDEPKTILNDTAFFGATVGPVAGRLKDAQWKHWKFSKNNGNHHIHGGKNGWSQQYWDYQLFETSTTVGVLFRLTDYLSGYPGPILVTNCYELSHNSLSMTTVCQSKALTLINPTNHSYFNLSGNGKRDITSHQLTIAADNILELDSEKIPTGRLLKVSGTPFDFTKPRYLNEVFEVLPIGLDDAFILQPQTKKQLILSESLSGRQLTVASNRQSMVLFSTTGFDANFMVNGKPMHSNYGLAIEPQELPDAIHHPTWGSIELSPNQTKRFNTTYSFSVER